MEASLNRLVAGDLHNLHNYYSALHAWAAKDFAVIKKVAFVVSWMDVKAVDGTWFSILRNVLWMQESNLNLRGIPPSQYLTLGDTYSDGSVHLVSLPWKGGLA